jgi:hypothetical protein
MNSIDTMKPDRESGDSRGTCGVLFPNGSVDCTEARGFLRESVWVSDHFSAFACGVRVKLQAPPLR